MLAGLSREERRDTVRRLTGQVPASQTYAEFLRNQPVQFQNEVMGKTKAALFRKGGLALDKFTNAAGKEYTIADLRRLAPVAFSKAGLD